MSMRGGCDLKRLFCDHMLGREWSSFKHPLAPNGALILNRVAFRQYSSSTKLVTIENLYLPYEVAFSLFV